MTSCKLIIFCRPWVKNLRHYFLLLLTTTSLFKKHVKVNKNILIQANVIY